MQTISVTIDEIVPRLDAATRDSLSTADVIIGVDHRTQREFTVFGMPALESTTTLKTLSAMRVVRVTLDCDKEHLEHLTALVRRLKGLDEHPHVMQPQGARIRPK
jgi:hypothetical protein